MRPRIRSAHGIAAAASREVETHRSPSVPGAAARESVRLEAAARRERLSAVLDRGSSMDRVLLALLLVERLTLNEAAQVIGLPRWRLHEALRRALVRLRRASASVRVSVPEKHTSRMRKAS